MFAINKHVNVLSRICGPKRHEEMGGWRKLHNEEFHYVVLFTKYYQDNKMKEGEMGGAGTMGMTGNVHRLLVGNPE
jgi:hypothetical protein